MSTQKGAIEEIRGNIDIVSSNKLNVFQSRLMFMGFIYEIILSRDIFPKNSDLKEFINQDMPKYLNLPISFKDYVFLSRPLLASRVLNKIHELDYKDIINFIDIINEKYLKINDVKKTSSKTLKTTDTAIDEWRNYFINKDKNIWKS